MNYAKAIAEAFSVREDYVANIIALLDEGNTIPFIARYRKEMHGTMDDQKIREISDKLTYLRNLDERREEVRNLIEQQENLTEEISKALDKAATLAEIEDIYRPFRPKRKTRASVAKAKGLQPIADEILLKQKSNLIPIEMAAKYVDAEKGVETVEDALAGASDIIAEMISDDADYLSQESEKVYSEITEVDTKTIDVATLSKTHRAIMSRVIRMLWLETFGDLIDLERIHVDNIIDLFSSTKSSGSTIDLPFNRFLYVLAGYLYLQI